MKFVSAADVKKTTCPSRWRCNKTLQYLSRWWNDSRSFQELIVLSRLVYWPTVLFWQAREIPLPTWPFRKRIAHFFANPMLYFASAVSELLCLFLANMHASWPPTKGNTLTRSRVREHFNKQGAKNSATVPKPGRTHKCWKQEPGSKIDKCYYFDIIPSELELQPVQNERRASRIKHLSSIALQYTKKPRKYSKQPRYYKKIESKASFKIHLSTVIQRIPITFLNRVIWMTSLGDLQ